MSNVADESFGNVRTVKAFSNEKEETVKFQSHNLLVYDIAKQRAVWYAFFLFFVQVFLYGAMAGIIYIAGILYQRGAISIGAITSFLFYMVLLLVNFGMVASVFGNVMAILGASDKIVEIMDQKS